ncbi:hypothetical protein [Streptomyces sp. NPDC046870]|uniref:hypothetical protein n=1 Tax=Streptomyces sp. NPDC046870 TaxID=3155135 RepID=UPI003454A930
MTFPLPACPMVVNRSREPGEATAMGDGKVPGKVLDIKTADIKAAAPAFHQGAIDLSKALTTLIQTLDGLGEPWGHDEQGDAFGNAYKPARPDERVGDTAPTELPDPRLVTVTVR